MRDKQIKAESGEENLHKLLSIYGETVRNWKIDERKAGLDSLCI